MLLEAFESKAADVGGPPVLECAAGQLDYAGLWREVDAFRKVLRSQDLTTLTTALPNGAAWVVSDLAALAEGIVHVPLPPFFSPRQVSHCLSQTGSRWLLTTPALLGRIGIQPDGAASFTLFGEDLLWVPLPTAAGSAVAIPAGVAKITYTSGTTGEPKGVMLSGEQMERVASALAEAGGLSAGDRHLCLTPLAVLLENIGGLYAPLLAGVTAVIPPLSETGLIGAGGVDGEKMARVLHRERAQSAILSPVMLQALVEQQMPPGQLQFLAVGGASVSPRLLERAAELQLPVYQGYGLSECASVVSVNRPGANRIGSVGQVLGHTEVRLTEEHEILLRGNLFVGYLGGESPNLDAAGWYPSGDIGRLDEESYLYITGRRKNLFITAFGRNVNPEWVEGELTLHPDIRQAALFGEARPFNVALIVAQPGVSPEAVAQAIAATNGELPDYASVGGWVLVDRPFTVESGEMTGTGRLRREQIESNYRAKIEQQYGEGRPDE